MFIDEPQRGVEVRRPKVLKGVSSGRDLSLPLGTSYVVRTVPGQPSRRPLRHGTTLASEGYFYLPKETGPLWLTLSTPLDDVLPSPSNIIHQWPGSPLHTPPVPPNKVTKLLWSERLTVLKRGASRLTSRQVHKETCDHFGSPMAVRKTLVDRTLIQERNGKGTDDLNLGDKLKGNQRQRITLLS